MRDPETLAKLQHDASEAAEFITTHVVQAATNERGNLGGLGLGDACIVVPPARSPPGNAWCSNKPVQPPAGQLCGSPAPATSSAPQR